MSEIFGNILRGVFLILLQVMVLNNPALGALFVPQIYILFLLALPFETPKWLLLPLAFGYGLAIDMFTNTPGLHAASCVWVAYMRPRILRLFAPREGYEFGTRPHISDMGLRWYLYYAGTLVLLHHTCFFLLEIFRFTDFHLTLLRITCSGLLTLALLILAQYLTFRPRSR